MKNNSFGRVISQVLGVFICFFAAFFMLGGGIAVLDELLSKQRSIEMLVFNIMFTLIGIGAFVGGIQMIKGKSKKSTSKINQNISQSNNGLNPSDLSNQSNHSSQSDTQAATTITSNESITYDNITYENKEAFFKEVNDLIPELDELLNGEGNLFEGINIDINNLKKKEIKEITCSGCGANNNVLEGTKVECEFCGSILEA